MSRLMYAPHPPISIPSTVHPLSFDSVDLCMHIASRLMNKHDTYAVLFLLGKHCVFFLREEAKTNRYFLLVGKSAMWTPVPSYGCWQRRNTSDKCVDI
jgi:hypothetical protein